MMNYFEIFGGIWYLMMNYFEFFGRYPHRVPYDKLL